MIPDLSMMRAVLIEDTEPTLPTCLNSQGEELIWSAPAIEGTLENRVLPLSVTNRVGE